MDTWQIYRQNNYLFFSTSTNKGRTVCRFSIVTDHPELCLMQPWGLISPSGCQTPVTGAAPRDRVTAPVGQLLYPCPVIVHVTPAPHCPASAVVRPPCPGCCWSPPPTDCTYHRPEVRAPDCRRPRCHGAMVPLCCILQGDFF